MPSGGGDLSQNLAKKVEELEAIVGIELSKDGPIINALTHPSSGIPKIPEDPERLEFLGDAALQLAISYILMKRFPNLSEGALTKARASLVNKETLSDLAKKLGIDKLIILGRGEELSGGRVKASILSDSLERIIGAIFLEKGFEEVLSTVERIFSDLLGAIEPENAGDFKSLLQELTQKLYNEKPRYSIVSEEGPPHLRTFTAEVTVRNMTFTGKGPSKKAAEKEAARKALETIRRKECQE